jgi:hypothetical protein
MSLAPILAHGLPSPPGVPVPGYLFAWAAAVVLVASFSALGALWREPRLEVDEPRRALRLPVWSEPACGALGIATFALLVYAGLQGSPVPGRNLAPTFVYVVFWVGLVPLTLLLGDVFSLFNPWRAAGRAVGWLTRRAPKDLIAPPLEYPERLGYWPAVAGLAAFAWLELVDPGRSSPDTVAEAALLYAGVQLAGMALYGVDAWERRGDAFAVYFALFARLSPVQLRGREVSFGRPLAAATRLGVGAGLVALLCVMIGTTSFDGLSSTVQWSELGPDLQRAFTGLGLSSARALELAYTAGLAGMILIVAGFYRMGVSGMRTVDPSHTREELSRRFIHTLIPIAAAYVLAHYFTFLVFQGQAMDALVSDPLGRGADLFGTAHVAIDYALISKAAVWYVQVGALVCGHVGGLVLAHDRALAVYRGGRRATRSQYWMLTVMVGFTSLGLFLLASIKR